MMCEFPVEKERFRSWLEKHRGEIVGKAGQADSCPLGRYVTEAFDLRGKNVRVSEETISYDTVPQVDPTYSAPAWAKEFIRKIDKLPYMSNVFGVTALVVLGD